MARMRLSVGFMANASVVVKARVCLQRKDRIIPQNVLRKPEYTKRLDVLPVPVRRFRFSMDGLRYAAAGQGPALPATRSIR